MNERSTVLPESIDPFPTFLLQGLHVSLTRYSALNLAFTYSVRVGKSEHSIHTAAVVIGTRYYFGNKDASS